MTKQCQCGVKLIKPRSKYCPDCAVEQALANRRKFWHGPNKDENNRKNRERKARKRERDKLASVAGPRIEHRSDVREAE